MKYPKLTERQVAQLKPLEDKSREAQGLDIKQVYVSLEDHYFSKGECLVMNHDDGSYLPSFKKCNEDGTIAENSSDYYIEFSRLALYPTEKIKPTRKPKSMTPKTDKAGKEEMIKLVLDLEKVEADIEKKTAKKDRLNADIKRLETLLGE